MRSVHGNRARQSRRRGDERRAEGIRSRRRLRVRRRRPRGGHSSGTPSLVRLVRSLVRLRLRGALSFVGSRRRRPTSVPGSTSRWRRSASRTSRRTSPPPREGDVAATISVPHRRVGLIIGRGGENVRFLQQQTRAHVQVQPGGRAPGADGTTHVYLRGEETRARKPRG